MKYNGKKMKFRTRSGLSFNAVVIEENLEMFVLQSSEKEEPIRIFKSAIELFQPLEGTDEDICPIVLFCENPSISCPGVIYIKEGPGFSQKDVLKFTEPCKSKCSSCKFGSLGPLKFVANKRLENIFSGTIIGDYPEEKKK